MDLVGTTPDLNFKLTSEDSFNAAADFNPDNCSYEEPGYIPCQIGLAFHVYILPMILAAGFFGNTCSFAIMMNSTNHKVTCCLLFAALAVSDNVALLSITLQRIRETSDLIKINFCPVYTYLLNSAYGCSSYLITSITYQRFGAVCKILTKQLRIKKKNTGWMILGFVVVSMVVSIPCIFTSNVQNGTVCAAYSSLGLVSGIWLWLNTALFFFIPVTLISYWNFRIHREVRRRALEHGNSNSYPLSGISSYSLDTIAVKSDTKPKSRRVDVERKLTRMMLFISSAFVCLSLPLPIRCIYYLCVKPTNPSGKATQFVVYHISNKLFVTNHAINFYLYCLSGAKFRSDFVNLVKAPFRFIIRNG